MSAEESVGDMEPNLAPDRLLSMDTAAMNSTGPVPVVVDQEVGGFVRVSTANGFDSFYASSHARIQRALALTLGDPDLASEATDEAMMRAYSQWTRVSLMANPSGWVYRVALNWATSVVRRRRHRDVLYARQASEQEPDHMAPIADPALAAAVADLPVRLRAVVVCRIHLDLSVNDTATFLNIRPGTVKSRLTRALTQLERVIGATTSSGASS